MFQLIRSVLCALAVGASLAGASTAAAQGATIPLYPKGALKPLAVPERTDDLFRNGQRTVRNVSDPSIEVFLPPAGKANGAAVIVAPGGAFIMLSYDSEGSMVAKRLAQEGVTAFVLKYRLAETPDDPAVFGAEVRKMFSGLATKKPPAGRPGEGPVFKTEGLAAQDAGQAVRLVRSRAAEWGLDPKRIGFVGFSAGAITAANISVGEPAGRPDFVGFIYGALRGSVPADAPPAFIATAADDPLLADAPVPLFQAWKAAGRPAELHIFERGGHGFGLVPKGASSDHWLDEFLWWMQARGLLKPAKA